MKSIKMLIAKYNPNSFPNLERKAIKELGGVENSSNNFRAKVFLKISEIKKRRRNQFIGFVKGLIVAIAIELVINIIRIL